MRAPFTTSCAVAVLLCSGLPGLSAAQDLAAGRALFAQCAACHTMDATHGDGPGLQGIAGRRPGSAAGFRYSRAMKAARNTWDAESLNTFLTDPQASMPGNLMPFSGIGDAGQRADLVAFLLSLK